MSWQGATFVILGAILLGGFAWYERSRPPSQIVALVAALAAISVAGRVAFSPIPNVVPTTDIVIVAGYALGGAPGFAVGALSGLVSNFWLGQGPWTPWQMAAWGMCGIFGAWLAAATRGEIGRLPLAIACAAAGFAFGAVMDFSLMVTYGGDQSLDRFLALSARGLPFNIAHAAGNAALALAAGPAMVRMLVRYRRRFQFAWQGRSVRAAGVAALLAALLVPWGSASSPTHADAAGKGKNAAAAWLRAAQNGDGGFGLDPGSESTPAMTGWAVLGLEAAGVNPLDLHKGDATPVSYLAGTVGEITTTGDIERTILVLHGAGLDPRHFQGHDLVQRLRARRGSDGSWSGQVNPTAFGILALRAAGVTAGSDASASWLRSHQNRDGGWGFAAGTTSDADSTGAVMQALAAAGARGGLGDAAFYLRSAQRSGGGFALSGGSVNAQSTAWAAQGLIAAGVSPASVTSGGGSPLSFLASVQAADGHYRYSSSLDQTPVWVTGQALVAVAGKAFPLAALPHQSASRTKGATTAGSAASSVVPGAAAGSPGPAAGGEPKSGTAGAEATGTQPTEGEVQLQPTSAEGDDDGGGGIPGWAIAVLAVAAGAGLIWLGWVHYQRRLPAAKG